MTIAPEVMVLPTYDDIDGIPSEATPWREAYQFDRELDIPGVPWPLQYDDRGLALVPTGVTKTASTASMTALLASDRLALSETLFLTAAVAGAPPDLPVGSVVITDTIVDWDDKCRVEPDDDAVPLLVNPYTEDDGYYELDPALVDRARRLATEAELTTHEGEAGEGAASPRVLTGTSVCADEFWHGGGVAEQVEWLVDRYDAGPYRVTEPEGAGTATALARFDMLDQYLSIRGVSSHDRPTGEKTPRESVFADGFEAGVESAIENMLTVARPVVEETLT
jgi:purine nucleoside permease